MNIKELDVPGIKLVTRDAFRDERGEFQRFFSVEDFRAIGIDKPFVEDNLSISKRGVIRGLHFQWNRPSTKLMNVVSGRMLAVAVDIRVDSPTLGKHVAIELSDASAESLYVPFGFATGICALSEEVRFVYKYTNSYNPKGESNIRYDDTDLAIEWRIDVPIVSLRDRSAQTFAEWLKRPESRSFTMEASRIES